MKKFLILISIFTILLSVVGCIDHYDTAGTSTAIVELPDSKTAETVNGYKNISNRKESDAVKSDDAVPSDHNKSEDLEITDSCTKETAEIVASKKSKKYHNLHCSYAKKINEENVIYFEKSDYAIANGYEPCSICFKK